MDSEGEPEKTVTAGRSRGHGRAGAGALFVQVAAGSWRWASAGMGWEAMGRVEARRELREAEGELRRARRGEWLGVEDGNGRCTEGTEVGVYRGRTCIGVLAGKWER